MLENNSDISKIKLDNTIYNIKDEELRKKIKELFGEPKNIINNKNTSSDK